MSVSRGLGRCNMPDCVATTEYLLFCKVPDPDAASEWCLVFVCSSHAAWLKQHGGAVVRSIRPLTTAEHCEACDIAAAEVC